MVNVHSVTGRTGGPESGGPDARATTTSAASVHHVNTSTGRCSGKSTSAIVESAMMPAAAADPATAPPLMPVATTAAVSNSHDDQRRHSQIREQLDVIVVRMPLGRGVSTDVTVDTGRRPALHLPSGIQERQAAGAEAGQRPLDEMWCRDAEDVPTSAGCVLDRARAATTHTHNQRGHQERREQSRRRTARWPGRRERQHAGHGAQAGAARCSGRDTQQNQSERYELQAPRQQVRSGEW